MNRIFSPQRAAGAKAIFSVQAGSATAPPIVLTVAGPTVIAATSICGGLREMLVFVDEPAPHARCVFMDYQNRTIRL